MIRASAYPLILTFALFLMVGCDGTAGPDGADAPTVDNLAPEITLLQPTAGTEIIASSMTLEAAVVDTAAGAGSDIERVRFYVDGSNKIGDDSAVVTEAPYTFEWDFDVAGTAYGPVTVMAEAIDTAGNTNSTALRLINRLQLTDRDTLTDRYALGVTSDITLPLQIKVSDGQSLDTIRVTEVGTRFLARKRCILRYVNVYPVLRVSSLPEMSDFWVIVRAAEDSLRPGEALDSTRVQPDWLLYDRWLTVNLSFLNESARTFDAGETFFISIRPEADPDSLDAGISIGTLLEQVPSDSAELETAYWYERPPEGEGWIPVAQRQSQGYTQHLYLEAIVDYQEAGGE